MRKLCSLEGCENLRAPAPPPRGYYAYCCIEHREEDKARALSKPETKRERDRNWSAEEISTLRKMRRAGAYDTEIGVKLDRSARNVRWMRSELGLTANGGRARKVA